MASIIERNKKFSVVYYAMVDGKRKQMWETFSTSKEAKARKAAVENEINDGTFIAPNKQNFHFISRKTKVGSTSISRIFTFMHKGTKHTNRSQRKRKAPKNPDFTALVAPPTWVEQVTNP
jgi:hypothetical protein